MTDLLQTFANTAEVQSASEDNPAPGGSRRGKVFIKSYGCQMNAYDAQRMVDLLAPEGFDETSCVDDADIVILNTCHIRERAAEKIFSELGLFRETKDARRAKGLETTFVVAGCVAQAEGGEILRRQKAVDLVIGPQNYHHLPALLRKGAGAIGTVDTDFPIEDKFDHLAKPSPEATRQRGPSAFLTVQEGCDKFCTFCVVPYTRGAEVSRPVAAIVAEAEDLADAGVREITVLGQNVNAYHGEGPDGRAWPLAKLLERLADVPGIARLRYTTSHPNDMSDDLIAAHRDLPQLMPSLHLPVQSGSDSVLAAMGRKHRRGDYLALDRPRPQGARRHCAFVRFHRRLSRRERRGFRSDAGPHPRRGIFRLFFIQIFSTAGNAGSGCRGPSERGGQARAARPPPGSASRRNARPSIAASSAGRSMFCLKKKAAMLVKLPARLPIFSLCRLTRRSG